MNKYVIKHGRTFDFEKEREEATHHAALASAENKKKQHNFNGGFCRATGETTATTQNKLD